MLLLGQPEETTVKMSTAQQQSTAREEILHNVDANFTFFQDKWTELCNAVERAGQTLKKWVSKARQHKFRKAVERYEGELKSQYEKENPLIHKHNNLEKERYNAAINYEKAMEKQDQEEAERWMDLAKQKEKERNAIDKQIEKQQNNFEKVRSAVKDHPPEPELVKYPSFGIYIRDRSLLCKGDFYVPREELIFTDGLVLPKHVDADFLVSCAILSVAYSNWITPHEAHIYDYGSYNGTYFDCDGFANGIWRDLQGKDGDNRIRRAFTRVKKALPHIGRLVQADLASKQAEAEPTKTSSGETGDIAGQERSKPMSKSKMMSALKIDSFKTFNAWAKDKGMKQAGNRQTFTIRLDLLDAKTRQKLERV